METVAYISDLLQKGGALFREIYAFNNALLDDVDEDYLHDLPVSVLKTLLQVPNCREATHLWIRKQLDLNNDSYNFSEARHLLCLLSREDVQKIIGYIGGICFSEQIRKTILGREVVRVKRALGEEAYLFSVRSGSLFMRASVAEQFQIDGDSLVERVLNTGRALIEMCLGDAPEALLRRFRMKFPKNFGWNFNRKTEDPNFCFEFIKKVARRALSGSERAAVTLLRA